jgi:hypothetical protein
MEVTTHPARIVGPVAYRGGTGRRQKIPLGPCLVETVDGQSIEVVWGPGENDPRRFRWRKSRLRDTSATWCCWTDAGARAHGPRWRTDRGSGTIRG